jgi:shikimate dehydrogenase
MNSLKELSSTDYGLIGYPLEHSFSKKFFTELFAARGEKKSYDNFALPELTPEALYSLVLLNPCLKGFNVTAPYKEAVMEYLDSTDPVATEAGAVNTVRVVRDAGGRVLRLEGFNTDVEGFRKSIMPLVKHFAQGTGAIVLGTGGASKAAVAALRQLGFNPVRVSRRKGDEGIVSYSDLGAEFMAAHPVVVNATPLGTYPAVDGCPALPFELLPQGAVCFDMVYNPARTEFMRRAEAAGAVTSNGLEMLHLQAFASLSIWEQ